MISFLREVPRSNNLRHFLLLVAASLCFGFSVRAQVFVDSFPDIRVDQFDEFASFVFSNDRATFITQGHILHSHEKAGKYQKHDLTTYLPRHLRKKIDKRYTNRYYFRNDTLAMQNHRFVALFNMRGEKIALVFHHEITSPQIGREGVYFTHKALVTYGLYNVHPKSDGLRSGMLLVDFGTKLEEIHEFDFPSIPLTHLGPNKFLSFHGAMYALCDPLRYRIRIYEIGGKVRDSLYLDSPAFALSDSLWRYFAKWDSPAYRSNPSEKFNELNEAISGRPRVWLCAMLNPATIFVRMSQPRPGSKRNFDFVDHVWKKQSGVWKITQSCMLGKFDSSLDSTKSIYPQFVPGHKLYFDNDIVHYSIFQDRSARHASGKEFYYPASMNVEDLSLYIYSLRF